MALTRETGKITAREVACAFFNGTSAHFMSGTAAIPPPAPNNPFKIPHKVPIKAGADFLSLIFFIRSHSLCWFTDSIPKQLQNIEEIGKELIQSCLKEPAS